MKRVLIYGDVDMNVIDGSSVWLQSVALAFSQVPDWEVVVLTKKGIEKHELTAPLTGPSLEVVDPFAMSLIPGLQGSLSPFQVRTIIEQEVLGVFDVVLVRGSRVVDHLCGEADLADRLWTYLTDIPQRAEHLSVEALNRLAKTVRGSQVLLCQSEGLRSLFEGLVPEAVGKTWLLPPMIPAPSVVRGDDPPGDPLRLIYAGKYAEAWNTLEMTRLPEALGERGISSTLTMIGDKIHNPKEDPTFFPSMSQALAHSPGVAWVKRLTRSEVQSALAGADVGLGWRDEALSESLEISTKLLEYGAAGIPMVVNRTPVHERLLGPDYPLFAERFEDVVTALVSAATEPDTFGLARDRAIAAGANSFIEQGAARLAMVVDNVVPSAEVSDPAEVVTVSHDFKFYTPIERGLARTGAFSMKRDTWDGLFDHDPDTTLAALDAAQTIICEWCGPNAVFASRNKRPDQKLIVRLHRFELYRRYPREVNIDAVDAVVAVSDHYRSLILEHLDWPENKVVVIPNFVDGAQLEREKLGDVRFNLGLIGIAPVTRKRFDRALRILAGLRNIDERFTLFVKSKHVWDYPYMWDDHNERQAYISDFGLLHNDQTLNEAVVFDQFGPDVPRWLRKIGHVLSTSDDESFHLAPVEGMASGAVPSLYAWPGSETIYREEWIHETESAMVQAIAANAADWDRLSARSKSQAQSIDLARVVQMWQALLEDPVTYASEEGAGHVPVIS